MPRIEEYLPQVDASGPQGGTSPNLDQISMLGRGIEQFGADVDSGYDSLLRRQEAAEVSDASATISNARAQFVTQAQQQISDGTIDTKQLGDQYDDFISQQADRFNTPRGQDMFNRQAERLKGSLTIMASRGQAIVAAKNAQGDFQNALNSDMSVVQSDPSQFQDVHDSNIEKIQAMVDAGNLPAAQAPKFQAAVGKQLSVSAVRGYMQSDFNNAVGQAQQALDQGGPGAIPKAAALEEAVGNFNSAKKMLDQGGFDQYLNTDDKQKLAAEQRQYQTAAVTEINRLITVKKAAQAETYENWEQQALPKLVNGGLTPKEVVGNPNLTAEQKYQWLEKIKSNSTDTITNPALKNSLVSRILLPDNDPTKISDPSQVLPYVGKGISTQDYSQLKTFFDKTPQGQALNNNRKMLLDMAKTTLTQNPITGQKDPQGEYRLMQFTNALQQEEQNLHSQNKPITSLYDPNDKNFFGNRLNQYKRSAQDVVNDMAQKAQGAPDPAPIQPPPGLSPTPPPQEKQKMPPPGLSFDDFKAWKKANVKKASGG